MSSRWKKFGRSIRRRAARTDRYASGVSAPEATINVVGLGLVGGSVAAAARAIGYRVCGTDSVAGRASEAVRRGLIDEDGSEPDAVLTVVAVPVGEIRDQVLIALAGTSGVVTDVGSVKLPVTRAVTDPRFVPGHPMAGSEMDGLDGADATMFEGATWVLSPSPDTSDDSFSLVASFVSRLGAEVVALDAAVHDDLVATVSHVPHLTAATLMTVADGRSADSLALLRLAAGGFRDMTRIASGGSRIWLDICVANRDAIVRGLDELVSGLSEARRLVAEGDQEGLRLMLDTARAARHNLPATAGPVEDLVEVRIPIPDRPGAAAEVFSLSGELGVNVSDFEVVHSSEGGRGIMVLVVRREQSDVFRGGLLARGFRPSVSLLS